jgi:organic hydroperoxide reductase OsmC/OhrA
MAEEEPEIYEYRARAVWQKERLGILTTGNNVTQGFSAPPEFNGHSGLINPEDAFVSSVAMCLMMTFLSNVKKAGVGLVSAEIDAKGILEEEEKNKWAFTSVHLWPRVAVAEERDVKKAHRALELAEKNCLIKNSIRSEVIMEPDVWVDEGIG